MLTGTKEIKLIESALNGDQSSFKELYEYHVDGLFAFLSQFSNDRELVKDWTQSAFIKAFTKLESFKKNSRFKTWLFTIGMNEMRTAFRKKIHFEDLSDLETIPVEEEPQELENWKTAKAAIQQLSPDKKMIVILHIAEGYSHREISEMLSIKEGTSRIILHRAKEELRNKVTQ
ncbi:MAG: RNA polymerase sigma factor [Balneolaceae bacterium]